MSAPQCDPVAAACLRRAANRPLRLRLHSDAARAALPSLAALNPLVRVEVDEASTTEGSLARGGRGFRAEWEQQGAGPGAAQALSRRRCLIQNIAARARNRWGRGACD